MTQFREDRGPFDLVIGGSTADGMEKAHEHVAQMQEIGVTWWMDGRWAPTTFEEARAMIEQGPPRI
jgi:hypothetical protein